MSTATVPSKTWEVSIAIPGISNLVIVRFPIDVDAATRKFTAFNSFNAMLSAEGNYAPSLNCKLPLLKSLADAYDAAQHIRHDKRRARRYDIQEDSVLHDSTGRPCGFINRAKH